MTRKRLTTLTEEFHSHLVDWRASRLSEYAFIQYLLPLESKLTRHTQGLPRKSRLRGEFNRLHHEVIKLRIELIGVEPKKSDHRIPCFKLQQWARTRKVPKDWVFGYVDASVRTGPCGRATGYGGCLVAPHGLSWRFSVYQPVQDSFSAELAAAEYFLAQAVARGVQKLRLHLDCIGVLDQLNMEHWTGCFEQLECLWVPRQHNQGADYLARLAVKHGCLPAPAGYR